MTSPSDPASAGQGAPASTSRVGSRLRIGVLGAGGQLGLCLSRAISRSDGMELAFATKREDLDLTDPGACRNCLDETQPDGLDVVINAAAFTHVDACESESGRAFSVNAEAPSRWAAELAVRGIRFVHISTDYVFAGDASEPYRETDSPSPTTVYGASKLAGEEGVMAAMPAAVIVRTSWVYGPGRNFVVAILDQALRRRRGQAEGPLSVVDDQLGSPTHAADLAEALLTLSRAQTPRLREARGILHLCNRGETTWFGFARRILDEAGYPEIAIEPVPTSAFPTPAHRPAYSVLDCARAEDLGLSMRPWSQALSSYLSGPDLPPHVRPEMIGDVTGTFPGHEGRA